MIRFFVRFIALCLLQGWNKFTLGVDNLPMMGVQENLNVIFVIDFPEGTNGFTGEGQVGIIKAA